MDLVEELKIENLREYLQTLAHSYKVLADEPMPDWYNMHDYSSGFYNGRKSAAKDKIDLINDILDRLEKLNG
jgi:hypothetical protein